jgi:hypothetical protein
MPIKISRALKSKLPEHEKAQIEELLKAKSLRCNLCGGNIDYDADSLVADHDIPEHDGGSTDSSNLYLVHDECNSFKQDQATERVRPFLTFRRFARLNDPFYWNNALEYFNITPITPVYKFTGGQAGHFELSNGTLARKALIFSEPAGPLSRRGEMADYQFCFVELPFNWIMNDEGVQPRRIYHKHVWNLYRDLLRNPLHEAPALRFQKIDNTRCELRMFDGQHKTVAAMLAGYKSLVFKVYLDLLPQEANILVNSIQDQITKLGLNVVESVNKFSSEFASEWEEYIQHVEEENASEHGFIEALERASRSRAKRALKAKLQADFFSEESNVDLERWLTDNRSEDGITKRAFSGKFLLNLISPAPLRTPGVEGVRQRLRERISATRISRFMLDNYWRSSVPENSSDAFKARSSRLRKQVTLQMAADLFRYVFQSVGTPVENAQEVFLYKELSHEEWQQVEMRARKYFDHPYWTASRSPQDRPAVAAADNHLERNERTQFNNIREGRLAASFAYALVQALPNEWGR